MDEIWREIPGCGGFYEVSNRGRVRSLNRYILRRPNEVKSIKPRSSSLVKYDGRILKWVYPGNRNQVSPVVHLHVFGKIYPRRVSAIVNSAFSSDEISDDVKKEIKWRDEDQLYM